MRQATEITQQAMMAFAGAKRGLLVTDPSFLVETTKLLHTVVSLSDKVLPLKAYLDLIRQMQVNAQKHQASEDVFMLAVSFLDLQVSKQGSFVYMKGESPDFKETKLKRVPFDLTDTLVVKELSSGLGRPNEKRGNVERGNIEAAHNYLVKAVHRHQLLPHVAKRLNNGKTKAEVIDEFKLTYTDFDAIVRMARRQKMLLTKREKDPENKYELTIENHDWVQVFAEQKGVAPRRALNQMLDDFRAVLKKRGEMAIPGGQEGAPARKKREPSKKPARSKAGKALDESAQAAHGA